MIDNNESDEMRLLKAFIKANGFDVKEEVNKYMFYHPSEVINGEAVSGAQPHVVFRTDYKVTKRGDKAILTKGEHAEYIKTFLPIKGVKCNKCGTHLGNSAPLDSCLCGNSNNLMRFI